MGKRLLGTLCLLMCTTTASADAQFEAYLDGLVAAQTSEHRLAGMTFALVRGDAVVLAKGYGFADIATLTPVDPARHLFRPGSVSKLFTWTAVMQLVEQGQLDLDADVGKYVSQFELPNAFDEPLTLAHLMTHAPGLEDRFTGLFGDSPDDNMPLADSLAQGMPAQVRSPGGDPSYSNWATALAGLIVANVSGMPFETYVDTRILAPLGMHRSTFTEPLPEHLAPDMATGYVNEDGGLAVFPFEHIGNFGPAGAMSATASDIAQFMLAHLNGGRAGDAQILSPATTATMHTPLARAHPQTAAMAHGFYETYHNGQRFIGHGGDTIAFHSEMLLDPVGQFGFFLSFNSTDGAQARTAIVNGVIDYFYPPTTPRFTAEPLAGSAQRIAEIAGAYRFNRRSYTTLEAMLGVAGDLAITPAKAAGAIFMPLPQPGTRFHEIEPYVFQQFGGDARLIFTPPDAAGGGQMHIRSMPFMVADKVGGLTAASTHQLVIALTVLASLFVLINFARNFRDGLGGGAAGGRLALAAGSLAFLLFAVTMGVVLATVDMNHVVFAFPPAGTGLALGFAVLGGIATLAAWAMLLPVWRAPACSVWARLRYTWVLIVFTLFLFVLNYWNMLGWKY